MELSENQKSALAMLNRALHLATQSELVEVLAAYADRDHINGVCEGVQALLKESGVGKLAPIRDVLSVEHWNAPRYGGVANEHDGMCFTFEVIDMRAQSGQMIVNVSDDNSDIDDVLRAAFEITTPAGSKSAAAALMLHHQDELLAKLFPQHNGYLIEPMRPGLKVVDTKLPDGNQAWMLLNR